MTASLKDLEWLDEEAADALLAGRFAERPYDQALAGGKLLRCLALPPEVRRDVRSALQGLFSSPGSLGAIELGLHTLLDELEEAWSDLCRHYLGAGAGEAPTPVEDAESTVIGDEGDTAGAILSLLLLRDDVEALRSAVALGWLSPQACERERLNLLRVSASSSALALDERVAPYVPLLRRDLVGVSVPRELLDQVWSFDNPWWLELVDPRRARLYKPNRAAEKKVLPLAASTRARGDTWKLQVEGRGHLVVFRDAAGQVRGTLEKPRGAQEGKPVEMVWLVGDEDREHVAVFEERGVPGVLEGELDESAVDAEIMALRQGGRLWVVSR